MIQPVNNYYAQGYPTQAMYSNMAPAYAPMQYQMPQAQNNAVKIDIINPQAGASQPAFNPYAMPQYSQYGMPMTSAYAPQAQAQTVPMMPQPYQVQQPVQYTMPPVTYPQAAPAQTVPVTQPAPYVQPQAPIVIPQPVVTTEQTINNAPQAPVTAPTQTVVMPQPPVATPVEVAQPTPVQEAPVQQAEAVTAAPQIEEATTPPVSVDLDTILAKLNSNNIVDNLWAIENIAETANEHPEEATKLLDTQVMDALSNIIKKDTTQLPAATPEQIELRQKLANKETLTEEQKEIALSLSEQEFAERNKQYSLYTISILQKLLSTEVEKAQGIKIGIQDLPMINDVVNIAKKDPNPMLRASALAALLYIATPENKELLTTMFEQSQKDSDPNVQEVATDALKKLSQV